MKAVRAPPSTRTYLRVLRAVVDEARGARVVWEPLVARVEAGASAEESARARAVGSVQASRLRELRRLVHDAAAPPPYAAIDADVDAWLAALSASFGAVAAGGGKPAAAAARTHLHECDVAAERFRRDRRLLLRRARVPGGVPKPWALLGLVGALLLAAGLAWHALGSTSAETASGFPAASLGATATVQPVEQAVPPPDTIQAQPTAERVAYGRALLETALRAAGPRLDLDAQDLHLGLVPPDRVVVTSTEGSVDLSVALTADGRVLFTPVRVVDPDGRDVDRAAPVAARVALASTELAAMLGPVRSVTVEPERVVVEMAR